MTSFRCCSHCASTSRDSKHCCGYGVAASTAECHGLGVARTKMNPVLMCSSGRAQNCHKCLGNGPGRNAKALETANDGRREDMRKGPPHDCNFKVRRHCHVDFTANPTVSAMASRDSKRQNKSEANDGGTPSPLKLRGQEPVLRATREC